MAKKAKGCRKTTVRFKTKRGKVISFPGRSGTDCGPRPKPTQAEGRKMTKHLRHYKSALAKAARACKGRSRNAFLNCVSTNLPK